MNLMNDTNVSHTTRDKIAFKAIQEYTAACTVVITTSEKNIEHGTGVAVQVEDSRFIITARHVLEDIDDDKIIRILAKPGGKLVDVYKERISDAIFKRTQGNLVFSKPASLKIKRRVLGQEIEDVGFLELESAQQEIPGLEFHPLNFKDIPKVEIRDETFILGFPREISEQVVSKETQEQGAAAFLYSDVCIVQDNPGNLSNYDQQKHFLAKYDLSPDVCEPRGMSGGGVWKYPKGLNKKIWKASAIQLVGIQTSLYRREELMKATRIQCLLGYLSKTK